MAPGRRTGPTQEEALARQLTTPTPRYHPVMSEERRLVTVVFADVVGSTSLGESQDPEDLRRLLSRFYEVARSVVEGHAGTLEKFIGDAAMAIFGLPQAHDDDARRAVAAALELRDRVREDSALGDRLPIRVGINTGEVVASREHGRGDFIVTGDAVNIAARLQQAADPWQVLVSARTASASAAAYELGPPQDLELKGKALAVVARAVLGHSTTAPARTPLVGRDTDLAQLDLVARRAFGERRPYMVSVIAPAGTGKSRLVEEFLSRLHSSEPTVQVAVAQCLPYGQRLTYWPMRALLLGLLDMPDERVPPDEILVRTREWLGESGAENPAETAQILAATIGASDTDVLDRPALFAAWRSALELAAARRPLVLLVEDLHWSSDSLLDLIEFILQPRAEAPMLMLALTRPELLDRRATWGGGRRNHVSLALEPLDEGSIEQIVENILDGPAPELIPVVVQRSEGNPFYAGEIVRTLLERGVDLHDPEALAAAAAGLPDTVQATVLARLDALDPLARRTLQLGSVFGRGFAPAGIAALEPSLADEIPDAIERLIQRELLRPGARDELTFRHILIRDVAYGTLPRAERALHHAAAGRWLESVAVGREDELAELVAFHYREAVVLGETVGSPDPDARLRATGWLRRAAEVAAGARGMSEAVAHLRAAIELAPISDQPEIHRRMGELYGSGDRSVQAYEKAWRLGAELGRPSEFLLDNLAHQLMVTCRWFASVANQPSEAEINELIAKGREWVDESGPKARATFLIAISNIPFWLRNAAIRTPNAGDLEEATLAAAEGLRIAEEIDDPILISAALDAMTSHTQTTQPAAARQLSMRRVAMGSRLSSDERLDALNMVAWTSALIGDLSQVLESSGAAMVLIQPGQNAGFSVGCASWYAYAQALVGGWEALSSTLDWLRARWFEAERPAASYGLQGPLSAIDWARNRGDEDRVERWGEVAREIIGQFPSQHPVAALAGFLELDLDRVADIIARHARYPDRVHYVEHALAICADHAHPLPLAPIEEILEEASESGMHVVEAQARRLRGVLRGNAADLRESLRLFEKMEADRYTARLRRELGRLTADEQLMGQGDRGLEDLGELARLKRLGAGPH
jgi:class 3 adenylate cyclase